MGKQSKLQPNPDANRLFPPFDEKTKPVGSVFSLDRDPDNLRLGDYDTPTPDHTFEIGLVLGGTVSAGCYTAGVLDYLIEALDAWHAAKTKNDPLAPPHHVQLKIVAGTSGGGINAILLARVLGLEALADTKALSNGKASPNYTGLFHDVWVHRIDITRLLETSDLAQNAPARSLLCGGVLDEIGKYAGTYPAQKEGDKPSAQKRDYVDACLPVVLTVTNLRGVPYASAFATPTGRREYYTDRADHLRFRVNVSGAAMAAPEKLRPDETWVDYTTMGVPGSAFCYPWGPLVEAARATSAFPVGLPPITIHRDVAQYQYRYAVIHEPIKPQADGAASEIVEEIKAVWMRPEWPYLVPKGFSSVDLYRALCVDGGTFNNEPIHYVREELAGIIGHNPRSPSKANRAVLLIDPFAESGDIGLLDDLGILSSAGSLVGTLTSGARFQTADISLFTDTSISSRFLITPVREVDEGVPAETGSQAIMSSGFGAFLGFVQDTFRAHDFQLGRRNCQQFLRRHFSLSDDNPLFDGWSPAQREKYLIQKTASDGTILREFPIIPLMQKVEGKIDQARWSREGFEPSQLRGALKTRLKAFADAVIENELKGLGQKLLAKALIRMLDGYLAKTVVEKLNQSLKDKGL